jgi:cyclohexanecarboxylate-CoA ligase/acyl-CoA synthetase
VFSSDLSALFGERVRTHPDRELVIGGAQRLTYGQVAEQVSGLATSLAGLGIRPGDRIGVDLPNWPEWVVSMLAAARLGATIVPIDPAPSFTNSAPAPAQ